MNQLAADTSTGKPDIALRKFPYPFRAALTLCSDIDGTHTVEHFLAIQNFLCSDMLTPMGHGLGLEIGNSFYPFAPDDAFAYCSSRSRDRVVIETMIRAGYIDCMHAFGEGNTDRDAALRVLDELQCAGCKLDVWTDHYRTPFNLGKDTTRGEGDLLDSPYYHLNRTRAFGIKFVWRGRGSSLLSQGEGLHPADFAALYNSTHLAASARNAAKEAAKIALAYAGSRKFALHRGNALLQVVHLGDGQPFYEFQRSNPHFSGLSGGHDSTGLAYVLRPTALKRYVERGGTTIIYTHLGIGSSPDGDLPGATIAALHGLAGTYHTGDLYITTTSRLLNYSVYRDHLCWRTVTESGGTYTIMIEGVDDPVSGWSQPDIRQLQGLTFYVPDASRTELVLYGSRILDIERNPADQSGRESISIARVHLNYPQV